MAKISSSLCLRPVFRLIKEQEGGRWAGLAWAECSITSGQLCHCSSADGQAARVQVLMGVRDQVTELHCKAKVGFYSRQCPADAGFRSKSATGSGCHTESRSSLNARTQDMKLNCDDTDFTAAIISIPTPPANTPDESLPPSPAIAGILRNSRQPGSSSSSYTHETVKISSL
ncbi:KCND1 protein, partial [Atractosteus spatula]|nr:KCND1 protein [Atractosteus spatula]